MIIPEIVAQHFEEASFLWLLRDRAVHAPHYSIADLAKLDNRVEAHVDGLRIAGDEGWELVEQGMVAGDAGEIFTAAVIAFDNLHEDRMQLVVETGISSSELSRGLVSALGWLPTEKAEPLIDRMLAAQLPAVRRVGVAASSIHRRDPGSSLSNALFDDDLGLRKRALRAAGELGRIDLLPQLRKNLQVEDGGCRFSAAWSAAILGDSGAVPILTSFVLSTRSPHPDPLPQGARERSESALQIVLRKMDLQNALSFQDELAQKDHSLRSSVIGAGVIGDPLLVPWLIDQMSIPELARVAGESFTMITGVDLAYEDLDTNKPQGFELGPTENPEDENVDMDPDEDLPWPNPSLIQKWWEQHKSQFQNGTRYLLGKTISSEHLENVLRTGRQRQRHAAALELTMLQPRRPLFEVRAPGFRQQQILAVRP